MPIPAEVWDRLKDSIKHGRSVDVALEIRDGVMTAAAFTERVQCQPASTPPAPPAES